jgi:hypothetical protein
MPGYRGLKTFTPLTLRFQDFQRMINFNDSFFHNASSSGKRRHKNSLENESYWKMSVFKNNNRIFQFLKKWSISLKLTNFATAPCIFSLIKIRS